MEIQASGAAKRRGRIARRETGQAHKELYIGEGASLRTGQSSRQFGGGRLGQGWYYNVVLLSTSMGRNHCLALFHLTSFACCPCRPSATVWRASQSTVSCLARAARRHRRQRQTTTSGEAPGQRGKDSCVQCSQDLRCKATKGFQVKCMKSIRYPFEWQPLNKPGQRGQLTVNLMCEKYSHRRKADGTYSEHLKAVEGSVVSGKGAAHACFVHSHHSMCGVHCAGLAMTPSWMTSLGGCCRAPCNAR